MVIESIVQVNDYLITAMITTLVIISLTFFGWFLLRRQDREKLFLGLFCLVITARLLLLRYGLFVTPGSWRIGLVTFVLSVPLFFGYLAHLFRDEFDKRYVRLTFYIAPAFLAASFLIPLSLYSTLLLAYSVVMLAVAGYSIVQLLRAAQNNRNSAQIILISIGILLGCGLNDILFVLGLIETLYLTELWVFFFSIIQAAVLIVQAVHSYTQFEAVQSRYEELDALKNTFLVNTAQELKKPLLGIMGLSESLLKGERENFSDYQIATLSMIFSNSTRLIKLVNDVLDYARYKKSDLYLKWKPVDLYQIVDLVIRAIRPSFSGEAITINNHISPSFTPAYADGIRTEQIFYNTVVSLVQKLETGEVNISAEVDERFINVDIGTAGQEGLYESFQHLLEEHDLEDVNLVLDHGISGLGLMLSKHFVELHGGTMQLKSNGENGFAFSFSLPKGEERSSYEYSKEVSNQLDALTNLEHLVEEEEDERNIYRVMVVDEDTTDMQVAKNLLASGKYRVEPALSGKEALEKINARPPHLVLLSVMLSSMNGYEVCRKIREQYSSSVLPVIMVTGKESIANMMDGFASGANDFLTKPYTQEEFLARTRTHLELSQINRFYSRFVPMELIRYLGHENIADVNLGDQIQREMTVLFVDIRAFTALSETMTPEENFKFINSYLNRISPLIRKYKGFVDKYIGDSIMALYPDRPEDAIKTAQEMMEHLYVYNGHRRKTGYKPINIGIGIHTGTLILGIIGDGMRMQGTVISDAVNLASRIQEVTKLYGANIVISQETFIKMENPTNYNFRFLGKVRVKGKQRSVSLFEMFDSDLPEKRQLKIETKGEFEDAILFFAKKDYQKAYELFQSVVSRNPHDQGARLFLRRSKERLPKGEKHTRLKREQ